MERVRISNIRLEAITESSFTYSDEEKFMFRLVQGNNIQDLKAFLFNSPALNLARLVDKNGYSSIHLAAYKNSFPMVELLCEYVRFLLSNPTHRCWRTLSFQMQL